MRRLLFTGARVLMTLGILVSVSACGDDLGPTEPRGPGTFAVDIVSPNGLEGSAVLEITGGSGLGVISSPGGDAFFRHGGGSTAVVIILDTPGQLSFQVQTQDLRELPSVRLLQVASGENELRSSVAGYDVVVVPVEAGGAP